MIEPLQLQQTNQAWIRRRSFYDANKHGLLKKSRVREENWIWHAITYTSKQYMKGNEAATF